MPLLIDAIGFAASVISFVLFLPQAQRTWQMRKNPQALRGVSLGTQWFVLCNATLWGVYAVITSAFWVGAPGIVNAPLAIAQLVLVSRARRVIAAEDACSACQSGDAHEVFVTAPPGWGSVMPCSPLTRKNGVLVFTKQDILHLRAVRIPNTAG